MVATSFNSDAEKIDTLENGQALMESTPENSKKSAAVKSNGTRTQFKNMINFFFDTWLGREWVTIALYVLAAIGNSVLGLECYRCLSETLRIDTAIYFLATSTVLLRAILPIWDFTTGNSSLKCFCNSLPIMEFIIIFSLPLMKIPAVTIQYGLFASLVMRLSLFKVFQAKLGTEAILTSIPLTGLIMQNLTGISFFVEEDCFFRREMVPTLLMVWLVSGIILVKHIREPGIMNLLHALIGFPIIILNVVREFKNIYGNVESEKMNILTAPVCKSVLLSNFNLGLETLLLFSVIENILKFVLTPRHKRGDRRHLRTPAFLFCWLLFFAEIVSFILLQCAQKDIAPPTEMVCDNTVSCMNRPYNMTSLTVVELIFSESCMEWPFFSTFIKLIGTAALTAASVARQRKVVRKN